MDTTTFIAETWAKLLHDTETTLATYKTMWPFWVAVSPDYVQRIESGFNDHPDHVVKRWDSFDERYPKPVKPFLGTHREWMAYFGKLSDRSRSRCTMRRQIFVDLVYDDEDGTNIVIERYHDWMAATDFETFIWVHQAAECLDQFERMGRSRIKDAVKMFEYFRIWHDKGIRPGELIPNEALEAACAKYREGSLAWRLFNLCVNGDAWADEREKHFWKAWHFMQNKKTYVTDEDGNVHFDDDDALFRNSTRYHDMVFDALEREAVRFGGKYKEHRKWYRPR